MRALTNALNKHEEERRKTRRVTLAFTVIIAVSTLFYAVVAYSSQKPKLYPTASATFSCPENLYTTDNPTYIPLGAVNEGKTSTSASFWVKGKNIEVKGDPSGRYKKSFKESVALPPGQDHDIEPRVVINNNTKSRAHLKMGFSYYFWAIPDGEILLNCKYKKRTDEWYELIK